MSDGNAPSQKSRGDSVCTRDSSPHYSHPNAVPSSAEQGSGGHAPNKLLNSMVAGGDASSKRPVVRAQGRSQTFSSVDALLQLKGKRLGVAQEYFHSISSSRRMIWRQKCHAGEHEVPMARGSSRASWFASNGRRSTKTETPRFLLLLLLIVVFSLSRALAEFSLYSIAMEFINTATNNPVNEILFGTEPVAFAAAGSGEKPRQMLTL